MRLLRLLLLTLVTEQFVPCLRPYLEMQAQVVPMVAMAALVKLVALA